MGARAEYSPGLDNSCDGYKDLKLSELCVCGKKQRLILDLFPGLVGGLAVGTFSKSLAFLMGAAIFGIHVSLFLLALLFFIVPFVCCILVAGC